ncbi:MAG: biotin--[acetyl-CoA-carboxylase] ligase [Verrucomicrobia bacterium]|nr:biotin--[acetyl-CoA-carboxylase] ligase [Verrucomicrobiota bacterium]
MNAPAETAPTPRFSHFESWRLREFAAIGSTNTYAGPLPAWTAVRATTQTGGRGRTADRAWVSDEGGLWLSAVLPCPGARERWEILPLAAGWAIVGALREIGVADLRLRWPNDIMVGRRKLAGLLVERYRPDTAVVGVGLNVLNHPELANPALAGATARLADLGPAACTVDDAARLVLRALHRMHVLLLGAGFQTIADELNHAWAEPRRVEVTLTGRTHVFAGTFLGIDQQGRLHLATERNGARFYDAAEISLLRELE